MLLAFDTVSYSIFLEKPIAHVLGDHIPPWVRKLAGCLTPNSCGEWNVVTGHEWCSLGLSTDASFI